MNKTMNTNQNTNVAARDDLTEFIVVSAIFVVILFVTVGICFVLCDIYSFNLVASGQRGKIAQALDSFYYALANPVHTFDFIHHQANLGLLRIVEFDLFRVVFPALVSLYAYFLMVRSTFFRKKIEVVEVGFAPIKDAKKFLKIAMKKLKNEQGFQIHHDLHIAHERESEHVLLAGSTGAGKTQVLNFIINDIIKRRLGKAVLFDIKGDFTAHYCGDENTMLVAPWDVRSATWHLARDIESEIDCAAIAEAFLPISDSDDDYFTTAAQDVLAGVLFYFHRTKGEAWGWLELAQILADKKAILRALQSISHGSASHIDPVDSPQGQGVFGGIRAAVKSIDIISQYWNDFTDAESLVSDFMSDKKRTGLLILAAKADMQEIATPLISALLSLMMRKGLALADSSSRRCYFLLDELGALPKLGKLIDMITLGRSKGMCIIAGTQDMGRLVDRYGKEVVQTFSSQFGTQIIGRLGDKDSAEWAAEMFGQMRVERMQISQNQGQADAMGNAATSTTWQQSDKAALLDSDFLQIKRATRSSPTFHFYANLVDAEGMGFAGKLEYHYVKQAAPYPSCVDIRLSKCGISTNDDDDESASGKSINSEVNQKAAQISRQIEGEKAADEQVDDVQFQAENQAEKGAAQGAEQDEVEVEIVGEIALSAAGADALQNALEALQNVADKPSRAAGSAAASSNAKKSKGKAGRSR